MDVRLVGLKNEINNLTEPYNEVSAPVCRRSLIGRHAVEANLELVQDLGDVGHQPREDGPVDLDALLQLRLCVVLNRS